MRTIRLTPSLRSSLLVFIVLILTLACTIFVGGPEYPQPPIPFSPEAVLQMENQLKRAAAAGALTGEITLQMDEVQLTSYLTYKLLSNPTPLFTQPQVYLRNGSITIYGKAQRGYLQANVRLVVSVGQDASGRPSLQLTAADFGPLPLPEGLNKAITAILEEAYLGSLGPVATGFRIQSITIADGTMTIVGRTR